MRADGSGFGGYGKDHELGRELRWFEWLVYFSRLRPYKLELTGGEPTLWGDLPEFVAHIPEGCYWAVTSNTLAGVTGQVPLRRCTDWTASFHGKQLEKFTENLFRTARAGLPPSVSLVATPDNLDEVERLLAHFEGKFRVNLLRELNPGVDWDGENREDWIRLRDMAQAHKANLVVEEIPPSYDFPTWKTCDAGHKYICAAPDGTVYRCYSDMMLRPEEPMGHISDFEPLPPGSPCGKPCAGCAADFRQKKAV